MRAYVALSVSLWKSCKRSPGTFRTERTLTLL